MKSTNKIKKYIAIIICLAIILTYFFINLRYFSRYMDSDIFAYSSNVETGRLVNMFNPHHLMFDYFGYIFYGLSKPVGNLGSDVFFNQKIKALLIASIGAGLIFILLYFISKKIILSFFITAFIVFAKGYLSYSSINDTPIVHTVLCLILFLSLYYFLKIQKKKTYALFLGIFHAFVILFHQSNLLFFPAIIFFIIFSKELGHIKKRLNYIFIYSLTMIFIAAGMYLFVGLFIIKTSLTGGQQLAFFRIKGTGNFLNWLSFYVHQGSWGFGHEGETLNKVFYGLLNAFGSSSKTIYFKQHYLDFDNFTSSIYAARNIITLYSILSFSLFVILFRKLYKKHGAVIGALLIWFVIYFAFFSWWEPDYFEFWLITASTIFIMSFFVFNYFLDKVKDKFFIKISVQTIIMSIIISTFLIFAGNNFYNITYKRSIKKHFGWIGLYTDRILKHNDLKMYK